MICTGRRALRHQSVRLKEHAKPQLSIVPMLGIKLIQGRAQGLGRFEAIRLRILVIQIRQLDRIDRIDLKPSQARRIDTLSASAVVPSVVLKTS